VASEIFTIPSDRLHRVLHDAYGAATPAFRGARCGWLPLAFAAAVFLLTVAFAVAWHADAFAATSWLTIVDTTIIASAIALFIVFATWISAARSTPKRLSFFPFFRVLMAISTVLSPNRVAHFFRPPRTA